MARLPDPTDHLEGKAKVLHEKVIAKRGRIDGMYKALLNHPDLMEHVSDLGTYFRFGKSVLPAEIRETVILWVAQRFGVGYEWVKHVGPAQEAGVTPEFIEALHRGEIPTTMPRAQRLAVKVANFVLDRQSIPQSMQNDLIDDIGMDGIIELVVLCGFYQMIAGVVFAFDVPLPPGETPPF